MQTLFASQALTADGWQCNVQLDIDANGIIQAVQANVPLPGDAYGILLPAPANLHSHAFQRALAGMTEARGPNATDSFWSWRQLMYRFLHLLTPEDIEAIAAFVQMQMLEAGYAAVAEFHYLHHQVDGTPYNNLAETSERIISAALETGIGLTLLPVFYRYGGCDQRPLSGGQRRFGNSLEQFSALLAAARQAATALPNDHRLGIAPHSLRAVAREELDALCQLAPSGPIHLHIAEQIAEVEEVQAAWGARPVEWLLANASVDKRWCLVHATQMLPHETAGVAATGAVAGLCPITEANLGDGIFPASRYMQHGGKFGVGSDSNIRISLAEELRTLEYSQRLRDRQRAVLATATASTGRVLFAGAALGGAQAAGRKAGQIAVGYLADLLALDDSCIDLTHQQGDSLLDAYIFAGDDRMVTDVWAAGRHLVRAGQHLKQAEITGRYQQTLRSIQQRL